MHRFEWEQVNAWRLHRHRLVSRAPQSQLLALIGRLGGLQAQLMAAAELQLWARVEKLDPAGLATALWQERTVVKTWAMRGTLHLLAAADFGLIIAARQAFPMGRPPPSYFKYHGLTPAEFAAVLEAVPAILSGDGITREQLAEAVARQAGSPNLRQVLLSGWGSSLKPSAFAGHLCFGPGDGQRVTFVRPDQWLADWADEWPEIEPQQAIREVARRFLGTYGPATSDEFGRWWGITPGQAKKVFKALGDEVELVAVADWQAWVLASTLAELRAAELTRTVSLLPYFDPYTIAVARHSDYLMPAESKARVYRAQGWIAPVVLVDGRPAGVWAHDRQRLSSTVTIELFAAVPAEVQAAIEAEVRRLGDFWRENVEIRWGS